MKAYFKGALKSGVSKFRSFQPTKTDGLDLSYIPYGTNHERIIAMCFPSDGTGLTDFLIRNDAKEVGEYLDQRHPNAYRIYNLTEKKHSAHVKAIFHGHTKHIPIPDHNVPTFGQVVEFVEDALAFLQQDPKHVIVVHCKAGKGRTGLMIMCFLMFSGAVPSGQAALDVFSRHRSDLTLVKSEEGSRTEVHRGVDQASQVRWSEYWGRFLGEMRQDKISTQEQLSRMAKSKKILAHVVVRDLGAGSRDPCVHSAPHLIVRDWGYKGWGSHQLAKRFCKQERKTPGGRVLVYELGQLECTGETKLEFWESGILKEALSYRCWFHPYFIGQSNRLILIKPQVDDIWNSSRYHPDFTVELYFVDPGQDFMTSAHLAEIDVIPDAAGSASSLSD